MKSQATIGFFDIATGRTRGLVSVSTDPAFEAGCVPVSPDGKSVVYHGCTPGGDIMLIDNFR